MTTPSSAPLSSHDGEGGPWLVRIGVTINDGDGYAVEWEARRAFTTLDGEAREFIATTVSRVGEWTGVAVAAVNSLLDPRNEAAYDGERKSLPDGTVIEVERVAGGGEAGWIELANRALLNDERRHDNAAIAAAFNAAEEGR